MSLCSVCCHDNAEECRHPYCPDNKAVRPHAEVCACHKTPAECAEWGDDCVSFEGKPYTLEEVQQLEANLDAAHEAFNELKSKERDRAIIIQRMRDLAYRVSCDSDTDRQTRGLMHDIMDYAGMVWDGVISRHDRLSWEREKAVRVIREAELVDVGLVSDPLHEAWRVQQVVGSDVEIPEMATCPRCERRRPAAEGEFGNPCSRCGYEEPPSGDVPSFMQEPTTEVPRSTELHKSMCGNGRECNCAAPAHCPWHDESKSCRICGRPNSEHAWDEIEGQTGCSAAANRAARRLEARDPNWWRDRFAHE